MVIKSIRLYILSLVLLLATLTARAQQPDTILKAMQDELARSMTELQEPGKDKAFFILYELSDVTSHSVAATFGSLTNSSSDHNRRNFNCRILVGDNGFNDESLEDDHTSPPTQRDLPMPLDDDYFGIRRSFWSTSDNVYKGASSTFERHKETLQQTRKKLDEIPHRSFAVVAPVKSVTTTSFAPFDRKPWEDMARNLSAVTINDPDIQQSMVNFSITQGHNYLVSSEGTMVKQPHASAAVIVLAQAINKEGEMAVGYISHVVRSPQSLPSEESLRQEIEEMHARLKRDLAAPTLEQDYQGPVLFIGESVATNLVAILLGGRERLSASDAIPKLTGFQFDENGSTDSKIGKLVMNEAITVKAKPRLKTYDGVELMGSFMIDSEGVMPAEETVIVENGVLKTLMNNRTITHATQTANGLASPGVLEITIARKDTETTLRANLLAEAKSQGLEYALIVKGAGLIPEVYKVFVADGREEYVRNANVAMDQSKTLRKLLGASGNMKAHNIRRMPTGLYNNGVEDQAGTVLSVISPEALLLESVDVRVFRMPQFKEEEFVSRPFK